MNTKKHLEEIKEKQQHVLTILKVQGKDHALSIAQKAQERFKKEKRRTRTRSTLIKVKI